MSCSERMTFSLLSRPPQLSSARTPLKPSSLAYKAFASFRLAPCYQVSPHKPRSACDRQTLEFWVLHLFDPLLSLPVQPTGGSIVAPTPQVTGATSRRRHAYVSAKCMFVPFTKLTRGPGQSSKSFMQIASWRSLLARTLPVGTGSSVARPICRAVRSLLVTRRIGTRHST